MTIGKNGQVNNRGEMMTSLLDSTDSDVEWLNLPPIKGKKPKKKKSSAKPRDTSVCDTWSLLKVFLCISMVGAVVLLTITTIWLSSELSSVRQSLKKVENKGMVNSEDVMKLQGVVIHINKTLEAESKTSKQLLNNITAINSTILELSESLKKLSEGMEAAPELKQIPEKLKMFSQTVADMGSDVSSLKETVKSIDPFHKSTVSKLENLTKQIEEIRQAAAADSQSSEELSPELANLLQLIPQRVQDLNSTVSGQIAVIMKSLSGYEERFLQIENLTRSLAKTLTELQGNHPAISDAHNSMPGEDLTSERFKSAVIDIVNDMLPKMSTNGSQALPIPGPNRVTDIVTNITQLLQRIDNLEKLQSSGPDGAGISHESLASLQEQVQAINRSLAGLQSDQAHVTSIVVEHSNSINTLTHQINATQFYVNRLEQILQKQQAGGHTTSVAPLQSEVTPELVKPTTVLPITHSDTKTETPPSTTTVTDKTESAGSVTGKTPSLKQPQNSLSLPGINSTADLKTHFARWSRGHLVNQVTYEDIRNHQGPHTPQKEELDKYDTDNSGSYSLEELSNAFGIPLEDEPAEEQSTEKVPPR